VAPCIPAGAACRCSLQVQRERAASMPQPPVCPPSQLHSQPVHPAACSAPVQCPPGRDLSALLLQLQVEVAQQPHERGGELTQLVASCRGEGGTAAGVQ
jgi:hypothetical protein